MTSASESLHSTRSLFLDKVKGSMSWRLCCCSLDKTAEHEMENLCASVKFEKMGGCWKNYKSQCAGVITLSTRIRQARLSISCQVRAIIGTKKKKTFRSLTLGTRMLIKNGWRTFRGVLREPIWTGQPISACYRMSCSLTVCFGWCQPLPSVFIFSFILPFIIQTLFQAFQVPHLPSFLPRIPFRQLICRHKQEC